MLEVIILSLLFWGLNSLIRHFFKKRIARSETAAHSVRLRKYYRLIRLIVKCVFVLIIIAEISYAVTNINPKMNLYLQARRIIGELCMMLFVLSTMSLPISGITIDKFKEDRFALYLRGFSVDDYNPSMSDKVETVYQVFKGNYSYKKVTSVCFSEHLFFSQLSGFIRPYCVGMTKELESPEGARRVFLDDDKWKEGVQMLIQKAKVVFVLVNASDSCVWEIEKCLQIAQQKLVFIVDSTENITELYDKLGNRLPLLMLGLRDSLVYTDSFGVAQTIEFTNDKAGYKKLKFRKS